VKILVSGASGLVGASLIPSLLSEGHQVLRLGRGAPRGPADVRWDPDHGVLDARAIEGVDAVVHLAGENIASGRWTPARKARILDSRKNGTALLASALSKASHPPKVFLSASAIGYYGNRGAEVLTEESVAGSGFLPEVCRQWEDAAAPVQAAGVRTVFLRIGIVLSTQGGALAKMLLPFRLGVGGRIGSGVQYMSWITLPDLRDAIRHCLFSSNVAGSVNAVSPHPVTNSEFTAALGSVLARPTIFPLPAFAARIVLGEMADELLLASTRVRPAKLERSGFVFRQPEIREALSHILKERI